MTDHTSQEGFSFGSILSVLRLPYPRLYTYPCGAGLWRTFWSLVREKTFEGHAEDTEKCVL
jgi:hypothetical protein